LNLSFILNKNKKVEHHIRIKAYKSIVLRFLVKSGVNPLFLGLTHAHWCCIYDPLFKNPTI